MGYEYVDRTPPDIRLDLHLDGHHMMYFQEGNEERGNSMERPGTNHTEFFELIKSIH